ncbi:hypothetical protein SLITK23_58850 [Streptomyces lividans]|nr:hypothetical protein SLITK23_58850 [Streptomyces lividans]
MDQSTAVISPRLGTPGQWRARMREAFGSTSACQASVPPRAACTPRSRPPYPEQRDPIKGERNGASRLGSVALRYGAAVEMG